MTLRVIKLSQCAGRVWWDLPLECGCFATQATYYMKIRKTGACDWQHAFSHDHVDGHRVGFDIDDDVRDMCRGYYEVGLFEDCEQIGEALLTNEKRKVGNAYIQERKDNCAKCSIAPCACVQSPVYASMCDTPCPTKCEAVKEIEEECKPCQE